jgi:hypothetical protein
MRGCPGGRRWARRWGPGAAARPACRGAVRVGPSGRGTPRQRACHGARRALRRTPGCWLRCCRPGTWRWPGRTGPWNGSPWPTRRSGWPAWRPRRSRSCPLACGGPTRSGSWATPPRSTPRSNGWSASLTRCAPLSPKWHLKRFQAARAQMVGGYEKAAVLSQEATASLSPGNFMAQLLHLALMFAIHADRGESTWLDSHRGVFEARPSAMARPTLSWCFLSAGRSDEALAHYEQARGSLRRVPRDARWMPTMVFLTEVSSRFDDRETAEVCYLELLPFEDRFSASGGGSVVCQGSVALFLGMAAMTLGRLDASERHLRHAIQRSTAAGARPWSARAELAMAELLRSQERARGQALDHAQRAARTATTLGMKVLRPRRSRHRRPHGREGPGPAGKAGAGGGGAGRPGPDQPGDRPDPLPLRADRREPRSAHPGQARVRLPRPDRRLGRLRGLASPRPDGTGAFPSVATLVRYTGLAERTVRTCLDRLAAAGIIAPCDPDIVAARIKRADRRPQGWDLNLNLIRDDLDGAAVAVLEHQFPGLGSRLAAAAQPGTDAQSGGVQAPHPVATDGAAVDNWPGGVQRLHPNHPRNHPGKHPPPPRAGAGRCPQRTGPPAVAGGPESSSTRSARPGH